MRFMAILILFVMTIGGPFAAGLETEDLIKPGTQAWQSKYRILEVRPLPGETMILRSQNSAMGFRFLLAVDHAESKSSVFRARIMNADPAAEGKLKLIINPQIRKITILTTDSGQTWKIIDLEP